LKKLLHWRKPVTAQVSEEEIKGITPPLPCLEVLLKGADKSFKGWLENIPSFYSNLPEKQIKTLVKNFPVEVERLFCDAQKLLEHKFDLLGSGEFVSVDPDRKTQDGYHPIDWYLDPVRNKRFPKGVHYKEWELYSMRPENADVKYPWELGRCQHWPTLAQAYSLSGDVKYAEEIRNQLYDFMEENPVGFGVNWTCTMDVAIRALNWTLSLDMLRQADLDEDFFIDAYQYLYQHGDFIFNNLENNYEVTSNHFLSNVVGLFYVSFLFKDLEQGKRWNSFCLESLETEMQVQILNDGADYESSIPYHRLVTEMFLGAARLAEVFSVPLSESYCKKLKLMCEFLQGVLRPDGLMPIVGDADDGRLHIFSDYCRWKPQDARHVFGPAGQYFNHKVWKKLAGKMGAWEAIWWGYELADEDLESSMKEQPPTDNLVLYPEAGLAVMRENDHYLLVTNGIVGTKGFGNHKHNDQLSFEYFNKGLPIFVDPGSYVYTSDFAARNQFRSVKAHNTICINDTEQNEMNEEWIFRLFESAYAKHLYFNVSDEYVEYAGEHIGYQRLPEKVVHKRVFRLNRQTGALDIVDELLGVGNCSLSWHFCCAPGVILTQSDETIITLRVKNECFQMNIPSGLKIEMGESEYSPSYGVKFPCHSLTLSVEVILTGQQVWNFEITSMDEKSLMHASNSDVQQGPDE